MALSRAVDDYSPISLDEMDGIRLMERTDTKFVTTERKAFGLLREMRNYYYVQEIEGRREAAYYTLYFDTKDCKMFRAHHNGKLTRQKLRIRSYVDSNLYFLEVKTKDNHGRTGKQRMEMDNFAPRHCNGFEEACGSQALQCEDFLKGKLWYDYSLMEGKIENNFSRVTLVDKRKTERLTIDTGISFHNLVNGAHLSLEGLAIIELKRQGHSPSQILGALRRHRIMPMGFSKYCIGMAMTDQDLRRNLLLPVISRVEKIRDEKY